MTNIEFSKHNDKIISFLIKGHVGLEKVGKDIVCASISSTSLMILNSILEVKKVRNLKYKITDGYLECDLSNLEENDIEKTQDLLISLEIFLKQLSLDYPKNVKFKIRRYEK